MPRAAVLRRWSGPVIGLATALLAVACGGAAAPTTTTGPTSPSAVAGSAPAATVSEVATAGPVFSTPLDAVPASSGDAIYFTASSAGGRGVFVSLPGRSDPAPLAVGAPLRSPTGIALSTDEQTLFVADPDADAVFTIPVTGGAPAELAGSRGLRPRGLEVAGDQLFVTGVDPVSHTGAVLALPVAGGAARTVGSGLAAPDSVAVGADGTVFVTDRPGSVLRISAGAPSPVATEVSLGAPAGLTLSPDGSTLLVSSLNRTAGTAQVLIIDLPSGRSQVFDDVIRANHSAGGLHRAHQANVAAWAGTEGTVYRVRFRG